MIQLKTTYEKQKALIGARIPSLAKKFEDRALALMNEYLAELGSVMDGACLARNGHASRVACYCSINLFSCVCVAGQVAEASKVDVLKQEAARIASIVLVFEPKSTSKNIIETLARNQYG